MPLFVLNNKTDKEQLQRLEGILQAALVRFESPRAAAADAWPTYTPGKPAMPTPKRATAKLLRRITTTSSAMNNLAVLLALQGVKLDEALKLVNQAIEIAGPVAAMLDSRASVYTALGQPKEALKDIARSDGRRGVARLALPPGTGL